MRLSPSAGAFATVGDRRRPRHDRRAADFQRPGCVGRGRRLRRRIARASVLSGRRCDRASGSSHDAAGPPHRSCRGARPRRTPSYPLLSRLLVADEPGLRHSGAILGSDIAQRTLPQTGLVVIDEAGGQSSNRGEGTLSLARAFMAAGVPAVRRNAAGRRRERHSRSDDRLPPRNVATACPRSRPSHTVQRNAIQQNGRRLGAWTALVIYGSDR